MFYFLYGKGTGQILGQRPRKYQNKDQDNDNDQENYQDKDH